MNKTSELIENIIHLLLLLLAAFVPIFFINQTTDFFEFPKLALLLVVTLVMFGLWVVSWIAKNKITIARTPIDILLLSLLVTIIVSTLLSPSRFPAIFGVFPRVHGSAVSWITLIIFFFVSVSNLTNHQRIKNVLYTLLGSTLLVSIISLMSYFKIYLPFSFAKSVNFTPTGSVFSTLALHLTLLPLLLSSIIRPNKFISASLASVLGAIFSLYITLTGNLPVLTIYYLLFLVTYFIFRKNIQNLSLFVAPLILGIVVTTLSYLPFAGNSFQTRRAIFPQEIQLPLNISWKISASAFRDYPFIGTGPGTYLFNFTAYKPAEFNALNIWSFAFDSAHNELLQLLATLGAVGLGAYVLALFMVINVLRKHLNSNDLLPGLSIAALSSISLTLVHSSTLISQFSLFVIVATLFMSIESIREKVTNLNLGLKAATGDKSFDLLPIIILLVFLIGAAPVSYFTYRSVMADIYHRKALTVANRSGNTTYQFLQKAESLNPYIDLYRIDMAQTNFALANAIAAQKGPSTASPAGSLTNEDRTTLTTLLKQSITEAQVAVALSPLSARNYEVLASIYRNITGVSQNALTFSLDSYGKAIQRDPLNPMLRLNAGGVYYAARNYDLAVRFFTDAVNLKGDYANAYYNLAIALRDKGDLVNAKSVAEQTLNLMKKEIKDQNDVNYKKAAELLADLTAKVPAKSTTQPGLTEPAVTTPAPVNRLPLNTDLGTPPPPSTPSAITR